MDKPCISRGCWPFEFTTSWYFMQSEYNAYLRPTYIIGFSERQTYNKFREIALDKEDNCE